MYSEHKPEPGLERCLECAWSIEATAPVSQYPVRPDGCMDILYTPGTGLQVVGTMTVEQRFDLAAGERRTGLRFRPGMARRVLKIEAADLVDRVLPLRDLLGPRVRRFEEM